MNESERPGQGRLGENILMFCRTLRASGIPVGPGQVLDALRAAVLVGVRRRDELCWALRAVLIRDPGQFRLFEQAFHLYFRNPRLLELEYKLLETLFLTGYSREMIGNPHYYMTSARSTANMPNRWNHLRRNRDGYEAGIDIFERILLYMENDPTTPAEEIVRAHLEYADWHLVFDWNDAAMSQYARAWEVAQSLALDEAKIVELFRPDYPMQLPLFTPKPNSREKFGIKRETDLDYDGWIDMRFTINGNGTARNIELVNQSANTAFDTATRLRRYLKNSPFRPRIDNGETISREDVNMRYYYSFQNSWF